MSRRLAMLAVLALLAASAAGVSLTNASFTTTSLTSVQVSTAPLADNNFAVDAGNSQTTTVGTAVATPPSVKVTDTNGNPVSGVAVTFEVIDGGGSVGSTAATTNASGIASAGSWTLGTLAGANTLRATATGLSAPPLNFGATGTPGTATQYLVTANEYAPAVNYAVTVSAQLADQYGNPVSTSGRTVAWTRTPTSGSLSPASSNTNSNGIATTTFTTGGSLGVSYRVTATTGGITGTSPAMVTTARAAKTIAVNAGSPQTATVAANVAVAPSAKVTDQFGAPISGVTVTFAVASGGGSITGASAVTNASGIATVGSWRLGTVAGANSLTASATGLTGSPVTFVATGTAGAATKYVVTASSYAVTAGDSVTVTAQLADQYGNAVATAGRSVAWTKTGSGGSFSATPTSTNASGIATTVFTTRTNRDVTYVITATSTGPITGSSPNIVSLR